MALDVSSLKVAELKAELKARDLSTTGLKAELAARLQEAIDAEGGAEAGATETEAEAEAEPAAAADEPAPPAAKAESAAAVAEDGEAGEEADQSQDPDVSALKVAELKEELKARGLPVSGKKAELAERLQEAVDAAHAETEPQSAPAEPESASAPVPAPPAESPAPEPVDEPAPAPPAEDRKRKRDEPEPEPTAAAEMDVDSEVPLPPEPEQGPRPSPPPNDPLAHPPSPKRARIDMPAAAAAAPPTTAPPPPPPSELHPSERVYVPPPPPPAPVAREIPDTAQAYVLDPAATASAVLAGLSDVQRALTTGKGVELDFIAAELAQELRVPVATLGPPIAFPSVDPWEHLHSLYVGFASDAGDEPNELATRLAGASVSGPLAIVRYTPASAGGPIERNTRSTSRDDLAKSIAAWAAADPQQRGKTMRDRFERMKLSALVPGAAQTGKAEKTEATLRRLLQRA